MSIINDVATVTGHGQIAPPEKVRKAFGVDLAARLAFELHKGGQVVVGRAGALHGDSAVGAFLDRRAGDIRAGWCILAIPSDLARVMLEPARLTQGRTWMSTAKLTLDAALWMGAGVPRPLRWPDAQAAPGDVGCGH